jgi:translin
MKQVKSSLKDAEKSLQGQLERREKLLKEGRDVIACSSRAIIHLHGHKFAEADAELDTARRLLKELRKAGTGTIEKYLVSPETEFVEASVVRALVRGTEVPSKASLGTGPEAYILGLLDSVGELKREVLDSLMAGKTAAARRHFASMEEIYSLVSPFAAYDHVVYGARRKIDVA